MSDIEAYKDSLAHHHEYTQLGRYDHCVGCGHMRLPLYDPEDVTDESLPPHRSEAC